MAQSPGAPPEHAAPLILIAEDNEDNRMIAATILTHAGYRVIEANNGFEVVARAIAEIPDLVLMDVSMPDIDGWTATRLLRARAETSHIKIVAFTAHVLPADREHAAAAGCDGYLAKPIAPDALLRAVNGFLGRESAVAGVHS